MDWTTIVIGTLMFAFATVILYSIGLKRKQTREKRLYEALLNNAAYRVRAYLKENGTATSKQIGYISQGAKAKEFMSSQVAVIADGKMFQNRIIDYMLEKGYIEECGKEKGSTLYRIPIKGGK